MEVRRPSGFPLPRRGRRAEVTSAASSDGGTIVDCAVYAAGERVGGRVALEDAVQNATDRDGFVWIGLHEPGPEMVQEVGERFGLHPLAVEDAAHAHQRPKLEVYGNTLFVVIKTARYVDSQELIEIGEVMVFIGDGFVVVVRHGAGSPLRGVRADLETHPDLLGLGPTAVLYAIMDRVVDDYGAVIEGIEVDIEEVEAEVFSGDRTGSAERIYKLKREVMEFRRSVAALIAPAQRLADANGRLPIDPRTREYFRDVYDHVVRDAERIQGFDDLLSGALQAHLTQVALRDNEDMRRISAWVAIIAVPTMVFGLYGMNFEHMPELKWKLGYPAVLLVTLMLCGMLYRQFKKAGWL